MPYTIAPVHHVISAKKVVALRARVAVFHALLHHLSLRKCHKIAERSDIGSERHAVTERVKNNYSSYSWRTMERERESDDWKGQVK